MRNVLECESSLNPKAVGDGGNSYGIAQIHLPSHPNISKAEALDAEFSIKFMAENFSKGKAKLWTCYRLIKAGKFVPKDSS